MKTLSQAQRMALMILAVAFSCSLCACGHTNSSSNSSSVNSSSSAASGSNNQNAAASQASSSANSNAAPGARPPDAAKPSAELVGTYELQEVHKEGVVGVMTEYKTRFTFNRDSTYSRVSTKAGKAYHTDTGDYKIVPPDKLLLSVKLSDRNIQQPPAERTHKFVLSPDGDELTLTSTKGQTAVFKRTAKPATK